MNNILMKTAFHSLVIFTIFITPAFGQTRLKPGFNLFSPEQDVEIGRQSAAEVEKQMPLLRNEKIQAYIQNVGKRLAENTTGPNFPYQFKVVDVADVNAFALPGGFMYVNRGLIEAAETEAELAGVMAHEISHVALRHGTNQASKAYMGQAGLGILGSLLGGGGGATSDIIAAVGGFGLNATFLKFSRDAEKQADLMGTQILARAGYDPFAMAKFFQTLREIQGKDPSKMEVFFSSHPAPDDRSQYVAKEIEQLSVRPTGPVGDFQEIKNLLSRLPKARTMNEIASGKPAGSDQPKGQDQSGDLTIDPPSKRRLGYEPNNGTYRIWYPANWEVIEASDGNGATFLPEGGVKGDHVVYGVIINQMDYDDRNRTNGPFAGRNYLERATNALIDSIRKNNNYLNPRSDSIRQTRVAGRNALLMQLSGISPSTGTKEIVAIQTLSIQDRSILYCLYISQEEGTKEILPVFQDIANSLQILK